MIAYMNTIMECTREGPDDLTALQRDGRVLPIDVDQDSFPSDVLPRDEADPAPDEVTRHASTGADCSARMYPTAAGKCK